MFCRVGTVELKPNTRTRASRPGDGPKGGQNESASQYESSQKVVSSDRRQLGLSFSSRNRHIHHVRFSVDHR